MKVIDIKEYRKKVNKLKELTKTIDPLLDKMNDNKELKLSKKLINFTK